MEPQDEIARLLAILVRRTASTQGEAILEFRRAGLSSSRIAQLLGTTSGTVEKDIQRAKKKTSRKSLSP
jgi:DNA-directed RNA polymerase specialized sigma24 family protein